MDKELKKNNVNKNSKAAKKVANRFRQSITVRFLA